MLKIGHFEKKMKRPPQHVIGWYLGRSFLGEADSICLGGWQSDTKFSIIQYRVSERVEENSILYKSFPLIFVSVGSPLTSQIKN